MQDSPVAFLRLPPHLGHVDLQASNWTPVLNIFLTMAPGMAFYL